ncbi:MAG TPA: hypothetical protein DCG49_04575 [Ruminococcus sp.]|nr:hypothetical protein [Ruminococcus sp.]
MLQFFFFCPYFVLYHIIAKSAMGAAGKIYSSRKNYSRTLRKQVSRQTEADFRSFAAGLPRKSAMGAAGKIYSSSRKIYSRTLRKQVSRQTEADFRSFAAGLPRKSAMGAAGKSTSAGKSIVGHHGSRFPDRLRRTLDHLQRGFPACMLDLFAVLCYNIAKRCLLERKGCVLL